MNCLSNLKFYITAEHDGEYNSRCLYRYEICTRTSNESFFFVRCKAELVFL
jgi:hypothetical protein